MERAVCHTRLPEHGIGAVLGGEPAGGNQPVRTVGAEHGAAPRHEFSAACLAAHRIGMAGPRIMIRYRRAPGDPT